MCQMCDPVVREVREIRLRLSEEHDHDVRKLAARLIEDQRRNASRLLRAQVPPSPLPDARSASQTIPP